MAKVLAQPQRLRRQHAYPLANRTGRTASISGLWNTLNPSPKTRKYSSDYQNILSQQAQRLRKAWTDVISAFPDTNWEKFSYHWLIVNTRSFYWIGEGQETPEDPNDAMGLVPFADYFNHADVAVRALSEFHVILTELTHGNSGMSNLMRIHTNFAPRKIMRRARKCT